MGVSAQIIHHGFGIGKWGLAVNHPFSRIEILDHGVEGLILFQVGSVAWENQLSFLLGLLEVGKELCPEQAGEDLYGDEEVVLAWYPLFPIRR